MINNNWRILSKSHFNFTLRILGRHGWEYLRISLVMTPSLIYVLSCCILLEFFFLTSATDYAIFIIVWIVVYSITFQCFHIYLIYSFILSINAFFWRFKIYLFYFLFIIIVGLITLELTFKYLIIRSVIRTCTNWILI